MKSQFSSFSSFMLKLKANNIPLPAGKPLIRIIFSLFNCRSRDKKKSPEKVTVGIKIQFICVKTLSVKFVQHLSRSRIIVKI